MKVYLDSCIVIYHVEMNPVVSPGLKKSIETHLPEVFVSDLVRLECRRHPLALHDHARLSLFDEYLGRLRKTPLSTAVFDAATIFCAQYRLKTPDAIHLAAAIESGCDEFWTNDLRLSKVTDRIKIRVPF